MDNGKAKKEITEFVGGKIVTTYKLRDWVFSRQRYWGEPIPLIFCEACAKKSKEITNNQETITKGENQNSGWIPVSEKDLPVKLAKVKNYKPTETGESPLAAISKWVNVKCPRCGGEARRETDTMPNWAGSSWYYLAYTMHSKLFPKSKVKSQWSNVLLESWIPVDWYNGGMEHTTLHLLYSRFWHKFLFDLGLVPTSEPYAKRTSHGLILAEGGVKMSKSKGNVVNPDDIIQNFGADTLRLYEMFMGPFDQHIVWQSESMAGPRRFLERIWKIRLKIKDLSKNESDLLTTDNFQLTTILHQTIKKVSEDIEAMRFNTAVSALMVLSNEFEKAEEISKKQYEILLRLLAPFAPHITEELWQQLRGLTRTKTRIDADKNRFVSPFKSIHLEPWPIYDESLVRFRVKTLVVQVNGKVRADVNIESERELSEKEAEEKALALPEIKKWLSEKPVKKIIYVKGKLINIVV